MPITDEQFLQQARAALEERRTEILQRNRAKIAQMIEEVVPGGDSIDHTTNEQREGTDLRLRDHAARALHQIEEAERRIDDGTYGVCTNCGEDISRARLQASPEAALCIDCKQDAEELARARYKRPGLIDEYEP